jgi:hypothetical protein
MTERPEGPSPPADNTIATLSTSLYSGFPSLQSELQEFDDLVKEHQRRFSAELIPIDDGDPRLTLEEKAMTLLCSALARARMLVLTIVECLNSHLAVGAFLATRAHFEMAGFLAYALREHRKWRSGEVPRKDYDAKITQLILGRRVALGLESEYAIPADLQAINSLTMLSAVDVVLDVSAGQKGEFRSSYEFLSEFCHPNSFAHMIAGRRRQGRSLFFDARPTLSDLELSTVVVHASISFEAFLKIWDLLHHDIQAG